jgi:hypothetical protein
VGESVLIHGGSSGIGYTAVQIAKQFGAVVFATVGNEEKAKFCRDLGADHVINYRTADFVAEVKRITGERGVDVILDMVGGPYIEKNISLLTYEGRLVQIAFLQGSEVCNFNFLPVMVRRLTITGSTLRPRSVEEKSSIANALREHVWPLLESRRIKVVVYKIFPLSGVAEAHRMMERSEHTGKIVLSLEFWVLGFGFWVARWRPLATLGCCAHIHIRCGSKNDPAFFTQNSKRKTQNSKLSSRWEISPYWESSLETVFIRFLSRERRGKVVSLRYTSLRLRMKRSRNWQITLIPSSGCELVNSAGC